MDEDNRFVKSIHDHTDRFRQNLRDRGLYTKVQTYASQDEKKKVTLAGACHFGEEDYFRTLEAKLEEHDLVLWEKIDCKEIRWFDKLLPLKRVMERIRKNQKDLASHFSLAYQYDIMMCANKDKGWEHCDMSFPQFAGHFYTHPLEYLDLRKAGCRQLLKILKYARPSRADIFPAMAENVGSASDNTIIYRRNALVKNRLSVLVSNDEKIDVAVMYGAHHMPDLAGYVTGELGMKEMEHEWLLAIRYDQ